jgi:hypothetical protein
LFYKPQPPARDAAERLRRDASRAKPFWPSFSVRPRLQLIYQSPAFLSAGLGVEVGLFGVLHMDIAYAPMLLHASLPLRRGGREISELSPHGVMMRVILGYASFRQPYFDEVRRQ